MITFGAKYRTNTIIERNKNNNIEPLRTTFAELCPKFRDDKISLELFAKNNKTDLMKDILKSFNFYSKRKCYEVTNTKYYVLTRQDRMLSKLKPTDILGVVEVSLLGQLKKTVFIDYLQAISKRVNHAGSGILDCIKKIYRGKDIECDAKESVIGFYKANGFNIVEGDNNIRYDENGNKYIRMRYSNPSKP